MKKLLIILLLLLLTPLAYAVQSPPVEPARGLLLVAGEDMKDPRFRGGELLLIQHDVRGSAALVINRRSHLPLANVVDEDSRFSAAATMLSYGGPIEPSSLLALVEVRRNSPHPAEQIVDDVYLTALSVLEQWPDFSAEVIDYRVFVGYAGWAPGQLVDEVERGDWSLDTVDSERIFGSN